MPRSTTAGQAKYAELGGDAWILELTGHFFDSMDSHPDARAIRRLHADDLAPIRVKLGRFLVGWLRPVIVLGKPPGASLIPLAHQLFEIGEAERDAWLGCMNRALRHMKADPDLHELLMGTLHEMASLCMSDDE
jgi:hemoglobin